MTVSGELLRVHLDEKKIGIYHEPTKRILDCHYDPEMEDFVVGSLRDIVHVTGRVELDANGLPEKIIEVTDVRPLDLRPLWLEVVETPEGTFTLTEPIEVTPVFEDQQVTFEVPELNLVSSGVTRDEAVQELYSDIVWLWKEYGMAPDEELSIDAKELRNRLRQMIREVSLKCGVLFTERWPPNSPPLGRMYPLLPDMTFDGEEYNEGMRMGCYVCGSKMKRIKKV